MQISIDNFFVPLSEQNLPRYGRNIIVPYIRHKLNLGATFLTPLRLRSENKHNSKIHCGSDYT